MAKRRRTKLFPRGGNNELIKTGDKILRKMILKDHLAHRGSGFSVFYITTVKQSVPVGIGHCLCLGKSWDSISISTERNPS